MRKTALGAEFALVVNSPPAGRKKTAREQRGSVKVLAVRGEFSKSELSSNDVAGPVVAFISKFPSSARS